MNVHMQALTPSGDWRKIAITLKTPNRGVLGGVGQEYLCPIHGALPRLSTRSSSNYYTCNSPDLTLHTWLSATVGTVRCLQASLSTSGLRKRRVTGKA